MQIGFIRLGNVGGKLAGSLVRNGLKVTVRDLERTAADDLLAAGAGGILDGLTSGTIWAEMSTTDDMKASGFRLEIRSFTKQKARPSSI